MQLHTLHTSEKGPVILWGMYEFRERELLNTYETIKRLTGDCDYTLIAFEVTDWNCEFSPWKSKEVGASFGGEASHTLAVLRNEYLPQIKEQYGKERSIYLWAIHWLVCSYCGQCVKRMRLPVQGVVPDRCGIRSLCPIWQSI